MPIRYYDCDEWYPVFSLEETAETAYDGDKSAEFTDEEIAHIAKVFDDFDAAQTLIAKRFRLGSYSLGQ